MTGRYSKGKTLLLLAVRQLTGRRRQSTLAILGIAIGVMILVTGFGIMDGLLRNFEDRIVNSAAHIVVIGERTETAIPLFLGEPDSLGEVTISSQDEVRRRIRNLGEILDYLRLEPAVAVMTPAISSETMARFGVTELPLSIIGANLDSMSRILHLDTCIVAGSLREAMVIPDAVIMGMLAAEDMGIAIGDRITFVSSSGVVMPVKIMALFSTGIPSIDRLGYVSLRLGSILERLPIGEATEIQISLADLSELDRVASNLEATFGYKADTWKETNASAMALFRMIGSIMYFLIGFVLIVGGMGVANVLVTIVLEKSRDIAILRSIGYRRLDIIILFSCESLMLGFAGVIAGCILGFVLSNLMMLIPGGGGRESFVQSDHLYVRISLAYFLIASAFALAVSFLSGVLPARRAAKLDPLTILRGER